MIYFIQCNGKGGPIKIGHTGNDIVHRVGLLQTGNPYPLKSISTVDMDHIGNMSKIYIRFNHLRMIGEWLKCTRELLDFIADLESGSLEL